MSKKVSYRKYTKSFGKEDEKRQLDETLDILKNQVDSLTSSVNTITSRGDADTYKGTPGDIKINKIAQNRYEFYIRGEDGWHKDNNASFGPIDEDKDLPDPPTVNMTSGQFNYGYEGNTRLTLNLDPTKISTSALATPTIKGFGNLKFESTQSLILNPITEVKSETPIKIKETSAAVSDTADYGQLWVKNETEQELYFTNDDGEDIQLTYKDHLAPTEQTRIQVRNDEGSIIPAGAPLYSKGEIGGSERILVGVCDANDSAKMPCIGIAYEEMNTTDTKDNYAVVSGVYNTILSGYPGVNEGDTVYVSDTSGLTLNKPTAPDCLIQNVGIVIRANTPAGQIQGMLVSAIGRTNDIPNELVVNYIANATTDTDKFLVSDSGTVKYRTGAEMLSDLGIAADEIIDWTVDQGATNIHANNIEITHNQVTDFDSELATKVGLTGDETIAGTKTFSGLVKIAAGGPQLIFADTTDDDDHKIQFWDESNNVVHIIRTSDNTGGGLGDSLCIGSVENKPLQLITQNATRMVIDGSGNVGIGTTSPTEMLHLQGTGDVKILLEADTDNFTETDNPEIIFSQDGGGVTGSIGFTNVNDLRITNAYNHDDGDIHLQTRSTTRMSVLGNGKVGIGADAPDELLTIKSSANPKLHIQNGAEDDAGIKLSDVDAIATQHFEMLFNSSTGDLRFKSDSEDNILYLDNAGNVGIGTNSPQADLHINAANSTKLYLTCSDSNPTAAAAIRFSEQEDGANNYFELDYSGSANTLAFHSNNQGNMFTLDRSNNRIYTGTANVGIGTSSPSVTLDVAGDTNITGDLTVSSSSDPSVIIEDPNGSGLLRLRRTDVSKNFDISLQGNDLRFTPTDTDGTMNVLIGVNASSSTIDSRLGVGNATPAEMLDVTGNAKISGDLTIDTSTLKVDSSNNRVGIGTTSPANRLHIRDSAPRLLIDGYSASAENAEISRISGLWDGNYVADIQFLAGDDTTNEDNGKIAFRTYSASGVTGTRMLIDETGNVGIGTTSPDEKLHVAGDVKVYSTSPYPSLLLESSGASANFMRYKSTDTTWSVGIDYDDNFSFAGSNITSSRLITIQKSTGNLGLGTTSPTTTLDVEGTVSYKETTLSASSDAFDVSDATVVKIDTSGGTILLGGFSGGVAGQVIHLAKTASSNSIRIENNESTGTQKIFTSSGSDKTISGYGGLSMYCDGTSWYTLDS